MRTLKQLSSECYEWIWANVDRQGIINACARTGKETQWKPWVERVGRQKNGSRSIHWFPMIAWFKERYHEISIDTCCLQDDSASHVHCALLQLCPIVPSSSTFWPWPWPQSVFLCRAGRAAEAELLLGTTCPLRTWSQDVVFSKRSKAYSP